METKQLPIGKSDFKEIIEGDYCYVDKTLFIKEVMDKGDSILLIPRPRRFGKTLNLSMLKYFYDRCPPTLSHRGEHHPDGTADSGNDHGKLFDSLAISRTGKKYLEHMGKYPVIFLSFRDIKELDWDTCMDKIQQLIQDEYSKHYYLLESKELIPPEKDYFNRIIHRKASKGDYEKSLEKLLIFMCRHYGRRVVILIDEYDAPVYAGYHNDFYQQTVHFIRNFLCGGLKDTGQYLQKSVLTGIMRLARESVFSGLNNPGVYTLLAEEFDEQFGFTEQEVNALLKDFNLLHRYDDVRLWYNGYRFGEKTIYNPWSIINFLGGKAHKCKPYWVNTSDNKIVEALLTKKGRELKPELEQLIRGESIEKAIEEDIILTDIPGDEDLMWSFLLMGGYLKQTFTRLDNAMEKNYYRLSIPNKEVRSTYTRIIRRYFSDKIENRKLETMLESLIQGEIDVFAEIFSDYVVTAMSFFDMGADPEKVYHAFVMGLFLWLSPAYQVKSNRESGYGRYDIMIIPMDPEKLGYIIEFKKVRKNESWEAAVKSALKQIEERKYHTELKNSGIKNYKKLAVVFNGKDVTIREG